MRIKIEDYFGGDIVELNINGDILVDDIIDDIIETNEYNIADEDENGEYVRIQLSTEEGYDRVVEFIKEYNKK